MRLTQNQLKLRQCSVVVQLSLTLNAKTRQRTQAANVITTDNTKNNIIMRNFNHFVIAEITLKSLMVTNCIAFPCGMIALIFNVITGV